MHRKLFSSSLIFAFIFATGPVWAQDVKEPESVDAETYKKVVSAGVTYLLEKGQAEDGSFSKGLSTAVTSMSATALMKHGLPADHPKIAKAVLYVLKHVQEDGGIYTPDTFLKNYETSLAILCLVQANKDGLYDEIIQDAANYVKKIQWDHAEGHDRSSGFFGGWGYGSHQRPDLSNTQFALEALIAAGVDESSVEIEKAKVFLSRGQNLPSAENTMGFASGVKKGDDDWGSIIYTPANGGETKVVPAENEGEGLRGYASMTYAGLKSFLYAGLDKDDIRVQAAMDWISRHYSLETNPGLGAQGLYYYYHVFAKALDAVGQRTLTESDGTVHNWRAELVTELAKRQREDGSWTNIEHDRWYEGDNNLVTCYALLSLSYCSPELDKDAPEALQADPVK